MMAMNSHEHNKFASVDRVVIQMLQYELSNELVCH